MHASLPPMHGDRMMRSHPARSRVFGRLCWVVGLVLSTTNSSAGAPQAEQRKTGVAQTVRTDLYGDPLPPGAVARLGTLRDNIGEMSGDIVLSADGKTITATSEGLVIPLRLWDVETGRVVLQLKELEPPARYAKVRQTVA